MEHLIDLNNQLLGSFNGDDTSLFVGKLVTAMLRQGLNSAECEQLVTVLIGASINCRLNGDRFRYVREVCPVLFRSVIAWQEDINTGISFNYFVREVIHSS